MSTDSTDIASKKFIHLGNVSKIFAETKLYVDKRVGEGERVTETELGDIIKEIEKTKNS
jgi:hypothetical protein